MKLNQTQEWQKQLELWKNLRRRQVVVLPFLPPGGQPNFAVSVSLDDGVVFSAAIDSLLVDAAEFSIVRALGEPVEGSTAVKNQGNELRQLLVAEMSKDLKPAIERLANFVQARIGAVEIETGYSEFLLRRVLGMNPGLTEDQILRVYREAIVESVISI